MPEPTPPLDLDALEARHRPVPDHSGTRSRRDGPVELIDGYKCDECSTDDYSAPWPCDVPALVARVRALEAENAELTEAVTELEDAHDTSEAMLARVRAASPSRDAVILADVLRALRLACTEVGDNDWPDDLHPADVIEKHLLRPVLARLRELGD